MGARLDELRVRGMSNGGTETGECEGLKEPDRGRVHVPVYYMLRGLVTNGRGIESITDTEPLVIT